MTYIKELNITLTEWEAKIVLELLENECQRLKQICESASDEDEIAEAGNEFMEVDGFKERLSDAAVKSFGKGVLNFSREPV